jgi:hypothetical protein
MNPSHSAILHGVLQGDLWWPRSAGQIQVTLDLRSEADRDVSQCGRIAAIKAACQTAGDFSSSPKLTADSVVVLVHSRMTSTGTLLTRSRTVPVTRLPSLADYVDPTAFSSWDES